VAFKMSTRNFFFLSSHHSSKIKREMGGLVREMGG
jgi:hypothetical protein